MKTIQILVPKNKISWLVPKSGICSSQEENITIIDFEGNLYNADNLRSFEERLLQAIARHTKKYPTMARRILANKEAESLFETVGTIPYEELAQALKDRHQNGKTAVECLRENWKIHSPTLLDNWKIE